MIELIVILLISIHILRHKSMFLLNFNIKTKKVCIKLYDIWGKYPDKAIKLGNILYTSSADFYAPAIPVGIYFLENRVTEGFLRLHNLKRSYDIPICILPSDLVITKEDGSRYPYYLVSNGPKEMNVILKKKTKMFEKSKESTMFPADQLVYTVLARSRLS